MITLFTFRTILQSCVASRSCWRLPINGSMTKCSLISLLPLCIQSTPSLEFFSRAWRDLMDARVSIGDRPEFSARARGIASRAWEKARMAYCSNPGVCEEPSVWYSCVEVKFTFAPCLPLRQPPASKKFPRHHLRKQSCYHEPDFGQHKAHRVVHV